jgi:hypothetical protein
MKSLTLLSILLPFFWMFQSLVPSTPEGAWEWQNPLPQGNTLRGVWGSSASNVFAVGDHGTILRYNSTSWSIMTSGTTRKYPLCAAVDALIGTEDTLFQALY